MMSVQTPVYDNHRIAQYLEEKAEGMKPPLSSAPGRYYSHDTNRTVRNNILRSAERARKVSDPNEIDRLVKRRDWDSIGKLLDVREKSLVALINLLYDLYSLQPEKV